MIVDFNMTVEDHQLGDFIETFALSCLTNKLTCHQLKTTSCLDFILLNNKDIFSLPNNFESCFSDHYLPI